MIPSAKQPGWPISFTCDFCSLQAHEAMRRAKFKFPGRQKIITSNKWGFTAFSREDFLKFREEGRLQNEGVHVRLISNQ